MTAWWWSRKLQPTALFLDPATPVDSAHALPVAPSADQNPIYDHANGVANSITASEVLITPPAGCSFVEIHAPADIWVRTDNSAVVVPTDAMSNGVPILVPAGQPRIVPVTATVAVRAISASGAAVLVVAVPLKVRS